MKTKEITFKNAQELKKFEKENRGQIRNINGVSFGKLYPILTITNKYVSYYDVKTQGDILLKEPYITTIEE